MSARRRIVLGAWLALVATEASAAPRVGAREPMPSGSSTGIMPSLDASPRWLPLPGSTPRARLDLGNGIRAQYSLIVDQGRVVARIEPPRQSLQRTQCPDGSVISIELGATTGEAFLRVYGADGSSREVAVEPPLAPSLTRVVCSSSHVIYLRHDAAFAFTRDLAATGSWSAARPDLTFLGADASGTVETQLSPPRIAVLYKDQRTVVSSSPYVAPGSNNNPYVVVRSSPAGTGLVVSYFEAATPNQASNVLVTVNAQDQVVLQSMATDSGRLFYGSTFGDAPLVQDGALWISDFGLKRYPLAPFGEAPGAMTSTASTSYPAFALRGGELEGWRNDGSVDRFDAASLSALGSVTAVGHAARRSVQLVEHAGARYVLGASPVGVQLWDPLGNALPLVSSNSGVRLLLPTALSAAPDGHGYGLRGSAADHRRARRHQDAERARDERWRTAALHPRGAGRRAHRIAARGARVRHGHGRRLRHLVHRHGATAR